MADWLNNNLSDYIDKKEKILIDVRKNERICHLSSTIGALFASFFLSVFCSIFTTVISGMTSGQPDLGSNLILFVIILCVSFPLFVYLIYNSELSTRYVLTNNGIYEITGLIFKRTKFVAYNQITDISMHVGPIQRIFGCGSVGVGTASGNVVGTITEGSGTIRSENELDIESVNEYRKVKDIIVKNRKK